MYTARRFDDESGLYYYRNRHYSPGIKRFLQPDPIGYADGMNIYAYCGNNPVNSVDPMGLLKATGIGPWNPSKWTMLKLKFSDSMGKIFPHLKNAQRYRGKLDAIGVVDPTGIADGASAIISLGSGDIGAALISGVSILPFGDLAKGGKCAAKYGDDILGSVKVIGRQADTAVAQGWKNHEVLNITDWTMLKNRAWIQKGIDNKQWFYLASPIEGNLIQTSGKYSGHLTVYAEELKQLLEAGYKRAGDYLVPPH